MKCPNCNTENPRDARFCSECGAPLRQAQTHMAETQKAAGAALALGRAARQAISTAFSKSIPADSYAIPAASSALLMKGASLPIRTT